MEHNTCLELALEGERLCKSGDFKGGVAFFEAAIQVGTDDLKTLSAIYSQLGNAFFYLGEYSKAMEYHRLDLTVARAIGDRLGEAKASGNLGNTLKVMGKFDEAIICCRRHLDISRELGDKIGEGRALYNLGNVYHAKGKHIARMGQQDPGEFPEEVKSCLEKAISYYEENLQLMLELGDRSAQGRAFGNLGNTHYLLGNFSQAISHHEERLKIAREFGDKSAERRAHSNLGNAHIFMGEFEVAAEHYKITLAIAEELGDKAVEAQACYSLGNTYTLLKDYATAIEYHMRHLRIAQELEDKVGEGRACWSLGNAHSAMGSCEKALFYANMHLQISKEIGDRTGQATAQMSIGDLRKALGLQPNMPERSASLDNTPAKNGRVRRLSMENMDLLKMSPDSKGQQSEVYDASDISDNKENLATVAEALSESLSSEDSKRTSAADSEAFTDLHEPWKEKKESQPDDDAFFDLLTRFQSKRMDDQRCSISVDNKENEVGLVNQAHLNPEQSNNPHSVNPEVPPKPKDELLDMIVGMQSRRLDEQRASLPQLPGLPGLGNNHNNNHQGHPFHRLSVDTGRVPDDDFFEMLMRCQSTRIEDQRSCMPEFLQNRPGQMTLPSPSEPSATTPTSGAPTVPDDDFFSLILRCQGGRIEDQRSSFPVPPLPKFNGGGSMKASNNRNSKPGSLKLKSGTKARHSRH